MPPKCRPMSHSLRLNTHIVINPAVHTGHTFLRSNSISQTQVTYIHPVPSSNVFCVRLTLPDSANLLLELRLLRRQGVAAFQTWILSFLLCARLATGGLNSPDLGGVRSSGRVCDLWLTIIPLYIFVPIPRDGYVDLHSRVILVLCSCSGVEGAAVSFNAFFLNM